MKAVLYKDTQGATLRDIPVPRVSEGEALISVAACGLCGTDIMKLATKAKTAILGHELAGKIVELGAGVKGFAVGDRVVVAHHVPCLSCHYCKRQSYSMCRQFKSTNIDPGGFAEYVRVPALHVRHTMLKIPDGLSDAAASQTEPLACCLRNAKRLDLREGDTVGIIGLGAVGQMMGRLLHHAFGVRILGLDLDPRRAESLRGWGKGFSDALALQKEIAGATDGRGLDALVFTAGPPELVAQRLAWVRDGGKLNVFASFHPVPHVQLDLNEVYHRELTVLSSYSPGPGDLRESLELIASRKVPVEAIETRDYSLEQFQAAVDDVRARKAVKAVLRPAGRLPSPPQAGVAR